MIDREAAIVLAELSLESEPPVRRVLIDLVVDFLKSTDFTGVTEEAAPVVALAPVIVDEDDDETRPTRAALAAVLDEQFRRVSELLRMAGQSEKRRGHAHRVLSEFVAEGRAEAKKDGRLRLYRRSSTGVLRSFPRRDFLEGGRPSRQRGGEIEVAYTSSGYMRAAKQLDVGKKGRTRGRDVVWLTQDEVDQVRKYAKDVGQIKGHEKPHDGFGYVPGSFGAPPADDDRILDS